MCEYYRIVGPRYSLLAAILNMNLRTVLVPPSCHFCHLDAMYLSLSFPQCGCDISFYLPSWLTDCPYILSLRCQIPPASLQYVLFTGVLS
jgi:hypothetical protein